MNTRETENTIERQFVSVADALSERFPDLDLRFTLLDSACMLRLNLADDILESVKIELGKNNVNQIIESAILSVRRITKQFDA
ncbi:hypothetical protein JNK13_04050 [bacterium]|nr:hypothetical protein [bacterium]